MGGRPSGRPPHPNATWRFSLQSVAQWIAVERKDFALGVRVEHPQFIVNEMRYHTRERGALQEV